jgi:serine O-acetyltransferase
VPGRVVVREGRRVEAIDLHHEDLPDPVIEMYRALQRRMDGLEMRLARDEDTSTETGSVPFTGLTAREEGEDDDTRL